ncbi:hypothetical protein ILYODFUR_023058 [Ilyodon furcidens]|uniref:Uncharacterized protein n=1 Tax=Ilyodon furcidens TaxID=33524 RepID=A0ABV0TAE2_9TELE
MTPPCASAPTNRRQVCIPPQPITFAFKDLHPWISLLSCRTSTLLHPIATIWLPSSFQLPYYWASTPSPDQGISVHCSSLLRKHRHLCFNWFAPNQQLRRQLDNPTSQARTLNPSTPGGSSNSNLFEFPVLVPYYFADNKTC